MSKGLGCTFALLAAALISIEAATISGVVKENDSTGIALSGAVVSVSSGGGGTGLAVSDTTDATGAYTLSGISIGQKRLRVAKTDYAGSSAMVNVTDSLGTYTANLYMISSAAAYTTISGTVTDSVSKAALSGAKVILRAGQTRDTVNTGATGAFSFDSVEAGTITLTVSLNEYTSKTVNLSTTTATSPLDIALAPVQYGSIVGTVTDSVTKTALSGATVILRQSSGMGGSGVSVDTAITVADGKYVFDKIASGSYTVNVSFSGYVSKTSSLRVTGTGSDTGDIALVKIEMGTIIGKVTSDSISGPAVSGATVILSVRSTAGGGSGTPLDTVTTDASGGYSFTNVASGSNYRIAVSMSGYTATTSSLNGKSSGTDTVNIAINKIGTGTLYVKVLKKTDSSAIAGASITGVITNASTLTGVTAANGTVTFDALTVANTILNVNVTAVATGFTASAANASVPRNGADTVVIYLAEATSSKMLKGTITDSLTKTALVNVLVMLSINGGGGGGGTTLTFVDTTGADGTFMFNAIPVNRTSGTLTVSLSGYRTVNNNNNVTIGAANTADTTTREIVMIPSTPVIVSLKSASAANNFKVLSSGIIELSTTIENGLIKVFSVDGKLLYKSATGSNSRHVKLPENITKSGKTIIVTLTVGSVVYKKEVVIQ
jgi:hypothetical protein